MDSGIRHQLLRRRRRHQPAARRAHGLPDADSAPQLVGVGPPAHPGVRDLHPAARERDDRRVRVARSVPVLRVLGRDAGADVLPHRHLGLRPPHLRGDQVPAVYDGRQRPDAAGDPRAGVSAQRRDRPVHVRSAAALPALDFAAGAVLAVPRVCARVRDQGPAVSVPHVAARRARRGADRRLRDSGRRAAEDGDVRAAAVCVSAVPGRGRCISRRCSRRWPWSASSTARSSRWCSPT